MRYRHFTLNEIIKKYSLEVTATGGQPEWNRTCVRYEDPARKVKLYISNRDAPMALASDVSVDDLFLEHIGYEEIKRLDIFIGEQVA